MTAAIFRSMVLVSFILQIGPGLLAPSLPELLIPQIPNAVEEALRPYQHDHASFTRWHLAAIGLWLAAGLAAVGGLLVFKRWGRSLAVLVTLAGLAFHFPGELSLSAGGLVGVIDEIGNLLWGAALACAYFSSVRVRFDSGNDG